LIEYVEKLASACKTTAYKAEWLVVGQLVERFMWMYA
jgi:hypothetical protein